MAGLVRGGVLISLFLHVRMSRANFCTIDDTIDTSLHVVVASML
jgi:hypothetical protein